MVYQISWNSYPCSDSGFILYVDPDTGDRFA